MIQARAKRWCAVALLSGGMVACWQGISRQTVATVLSIHGEVTVASRGSRAFRALGEGERVGRGDAIRTSIGAAADVFLLPGLIARIHENAAVVLAELILTKDGDETGGGTRERIAQIKLQRGIVDLSFEQGEDVAGLVVVRLPGADLSAKPGTLFRVTLGNDHSRVTAANGEVTVSAGTKNPVKVARATFVDLKPGKPLASQNVVSDDLAQRDLSDLVDSAAELASLDIPLPRPVAAAQRR